MRICRPTLQIGSQLGDTFRVGSKGPFWRQGPHGKDHRLRHKGTCKGYRHLCGSAGQLFRSDPSSVILSESAARGLFGDKDPMGKTIVFDTKEPAKVTGIYADLPANSSDRIPAR